MSNFEKVKLNNGSVYEIVPGGLRESTDKTKLTIIALLEEKILSDVDAETDIPENVKLIKILDSTGDETDFKKGYKYQIGCKKQKNYVLSREAVDTGILDEEGNPIIEYQDVLATVVIIELSTGDLRAELEEAKAEIKELNTTVDALVIASLEV